MKNWLFGFIFSLLFIATVWADPFLICVPQTNVTNYNITGDIVATVPAYDLGDGTVRLEYGLSGLADGNYTCNVTAENIWRESAPVPFSFTVAGPDCPSVLEVIAK